MTQATQDSRGTQSHTKLPPQLQKLVDNEDDIFYDDVYSPYHVNTTESPYRYAAYANRIRTILLSAHRYVAYTSDIGESFRPVAHPYLVKTAYGISWTYIIGDVAHEGYKAYLRNRRVLAPPCENYKNASSTSSPTSEGMDVFRGMVTGDISGEHETLTPWPTTRIPLIEDYRVVMAKRGIFQSLASMGLPALTIHSVVRYSGRMMKNAKSVMLRTWGPIGLGLAVVPLLPYLFDEPVEHAVEWAFRTGLRAYAGEDAVRPLPASAIEDTTSLGRFVDLGKLKASEGKLKGESVSEAVEVTWDEFKEQKLREKEERNKKREEQGVTGPLALLGLKSGAEKKDKNE